jgi:hypothetical protein
MWDTQKKTATSIVFGGGDSLFLFFSIFWGGEAYFYFYFIFNLSSSVSSGVFSSENTQDKKLAAMGAACCRCVLRPHSKAAVKQQ